MALMTSQGMECQSNYHQPQSRGPGATPPAGALQGPPGFNDDFLFVFTEKSPLLISQKVQPTQGLDLSVAMVTILVEP